MKRKSLKRGLAIVLSALMIMSSVPVYAEEPQSSQTQTEADGSVESSQDGESGEDGESKPEESAPDKGSEPEEGSATPAESESGESKPEEDSDIPAESKPATETEPTETLGMESAETETTGEAETEIMVEEPTETETGTEMQKIVAFADIQDVITFNTGNLEISVIPSDDYSDELFEACLDDNIYVVPFDEDGNFTIEAEADAFFPYEVQFRYDGKIENRWFLSPYDRTTVGGHTFCIHSEFSGDVITQMSLKVAGETVVVYPQKKEFTNDGGISTYSLMPLEEKYLTVDLTGLNPLQLTRVAVSSVFAGENSISAEKIAWNSQYGDDYKIVSPGELLDLSYDTTNDGTTSWEMIVGDADQLNLSNIRYRVSVNTNNARFWLNPAIYERNNDGSFTDNLTKSAKYWDNSYSNNDKWDWSRHEEIHLYDSSNAGNNTLFLKLNRERFGSDIVKVYKGKLNSPDEAGHAEEITSEIFDGQGYNLPGRYREYITLISYDGNGNVTGFLPLYFYVYVEDEGFNFNVENEKGEDCYYTYSSRTENDCEFTTYELYKGNPADQQYYLSAYHMIDGNSTSSASGITVYKGLYNTIEEAQNSGAEDVTSAMFDKGNGENGYLGNYSQGVDFTFFTTSKVFHYNVKVVEGEHEKRQYLSSSSKFRVQGFSDVDGRYVKAYGVATDEDSYAEYNYLTILVDKDVDLTNLALRFYTSDIKAKVYCEGSSSPEVSGETRHDFSKGVMQYTVSAEDGKNATNYWIQVVKPDASNEKLYVNSLIDSDAKTEVRDGITYTTREVMIDGVHNYVHDILLANMGNADLSKISVELDSDSVELDPYWTLSGRQNLGIFNSGEINDNKFYGELSNLAKIRLKQKDGVSDGTDVSGTLKIKADGKELINMTLTGTVGDPTIMTTEIPNAVKYVPYGTIIQNNNKYSANKVSYFLQAGKLPEGMELKSNGEIYGVPKEAGTFHIKLRMENFISSFSSCTREFDLVVLDNTDENVNNATDEGYTLSTRLSQAGAEYVVVSEGVFPNFKYIYIDGDRLVKGVDYDAESGSTRITIRSETLSKKGSGVHTLGIEFREGGEDTGELKRAAQNYDAADIGVVEKPSNNNSNNNSSSNSSSNNSSPSNSQAVSDTKDALVEVVSVEGFADKGGYTMMQANLSRDKVLQAELLNKYYGQPMYMNVFFSADFGMTIDMANVLMMTNDVQIVYSIVSDPLIAPEFDVLHAIPDAIKPLEFEAIFNFHVGDEYIGKKAYIYVLNELGTGYDLARVSIVNEIGNIAFASANVSDVIILIEK